MNIIYVEARDLPDAWFQCIWQLLDHGHRYKIDRGSYKDQYRIEFDYITIRVKFPDYRPLIPDIPAGLGIPNPVEEGYIEQYLPYLMTPEKKPNEEYTYGQRLTGYKEYRDYGALFVTDQMSEVIRMYKDSGFGTNQACMAVAVPRDIYSSDPPCLRSIDTRIRYDKLHFIVYFRSWDLWNGFPANLGALQLMKEFMVDEIGVEDGEIIASSKGLHIYGYVEELARLRTMKRKQQIYINRKDGIEGGL